MTGFFRLYDFFRYILENICQYLDSSAMVSRVLLLLYTLVSAFFLLLLVQLHAALSENSRLLEKYVELERKLNSKTSLLEVESTQTLVPIPISNDIKEGDCGGGSIHISQSISTNRPPMGAAVTLMHNQPKWFQRRYVMLLLYHSRHMG